MISLSRLWDEAPVEPRGLFRWLYFHYAIRCPMPDGDVEKRLGDQGLVEFVEKIHGYWRRSPMARANR